MYKKTKGLGMTKKTKRQPRCFKLIHKKSKYMSRMLSMNGWADLQTAPPFAS